MYALGIIIMGHAATMEERLAMGASTEARTTKRTYQFKGTHTPAHIGFPPYECADVVAYMGRTGQFLADDFASKLVPCHRVCSRYQSF